MEKLEKRERSWDERDIKWERQGEWEKEGREREE